LSPVVGMRMASGSATPTAYEYHLARQRNILYERQALVASAQKTTPQAFVRASPSVFVTQRLAQTFASPAPSMPT
jgi:hypothetical protein